MLAIPSPFPIEISETAHRPRGCTEHWFFVGLDINKDDMQKGELLSGCQNEPVSFPELIFTVC